MPASAAPLWPRPLVSGDSLSLPHLVPFVKSFFKLFFKVFLLPAGPPLWLRVFCFPAAQRSLILANLSPLVNPFFRFFSSFFFSAFYTLYIRIFSRFYHKILPTPTAGPGAKSTGSGFPPGQSSSSGRLPAPGGPAPRRRQPAPRPRGSPPVPFGGTAAPP